MPRVNYTIEFPCRSVVASCPFLASYVVPGRKAESKGGSGWGSNVMLGPLPPLSPKLCGRGQGSFWVFVLVQVVAGF